MNKYNIGDLIVDDEGEAYTITEVLSFIDDTYGYDTEYYDKDNQRVLPYYISERRIDELIAGKEGIEIKYYPVKKD